MKKLKSLREGLISTMEGENSLQASIPPGHHAIQGTSGYIVMPDELTVEEWGAWQDSPEHIEAEERAKEERESNSGVQKAHKTPHSRNGAQVRNITVQAPTPADEEAQEAAFDRLFPELNDD